MSAHYEATKEEALNVVTRNVPERATSELLFIAVNILNDIRAELEVLNGRYQK